MRIEATEVTEILKRQIADYKSTVDISEVGTVIQASDGIARILRRLDEANTKAAIPEGLGPVHFRPNQVTLHEGAGGFRTLQGDPRTIIPGNQIAGSRSERS